MNVIYTKHADERLAQRNINSAKIREMFDKGVHFADLSDERKRYCVYRENAFEFITLVYKSRKETAILITAYPSKNWEKNEFRRKWRK
jgi:hypothetical protein